MFRNLSSIGFRVNQCSFTMGSEFTRCGFRNGLGNYLAFVRVRLEIDGLDVRVDQGFI